MPALLTIAIPTYNRCVHLQRLLAALGDMVPDLAEKVRIIVSDNASTDDTPEVIAGFVERFPFVRGLRNASNIGADSNIARCFAIAETQYVWIIGDDDMPKVGVIGAIVDLLVNESPDMVYAPSEWLPDVIHPAQGRPFDPRQYRLMDRVQFARHVNVWLTFLSGIIVRRGDADRAGMAALDGSCLVQLGWILPALRDGTKFVALDDDAILATAANTGGYSAVKVFGANLPAVVAGALGRGSAEYRAIVGQTVSGYLPQLIWTIRTGKGGGLDPDMPWPLLQAQIGRFPAFWALAVPVGRAPLPIARGVLLVADLVSRARRKWRRMRHRQRHRRP